MSAKFIQISFSGLWRRPMLAAIMVYWIALCAAALILALAVRLDAGAHLPHLALAAPKISTAATSG